MIFTAFHAKVKRKLASLLVVNLTKALNETSPALCGRQVADHIVNPS